MSRISIQNCRCHKLGAGETEAWRDRGRRCRQAGRAREREAVKPGKAGKFGDGGINARGDGGAGIVSEDEAADERDLFIGLEARADGQPEFLEDESGEFLRVGMLELRARFVVIESEMAALVFSEAAKQLGENRVFRAAGEDAVSFESGQL